MSIIGFKMYKARISRSILHMQNFRKYEHTPLEKTKMLRYYRNGSCKITFSKPLAAHKLPTQLKFWKVEISHADRWISRVTIKLIDSQILVPVIWQTLNILAKES